MEESPLVLPAVLTRDSALTVRDVVVARLERGQRRIELDLSEVERADSFGVAALLDSYEQAKARGGDLVISNVSEELAGLFAFFRVDRVLEAEEEAPPRPPALLCLAALALGSLSGTTSPLGKMNTMRVTWESAGLN